MKKYEAPEALVVEFDAIDLLGNTPEGVVPGDEGPAEEIDW